MQPAKDVIMKLSQNTRQLPELISFLSIRRSIGYLGICLPFLLILITGIFGCWQLLPSISQYYYTVAGNVLVGVLCAVGLFLITYKGFSALDDLLTNMAGIFAFGIALCPTGEHERNKCAVFSYPESDVRSLIHYGSAALFFITLASISFFLFTRSEGFKTPEKKIRNRIYRTSAALMIIFIALVPLIPLLVPHPKNLNATFWLETGALISFGISWLVKGEVLFKDNIHIKK